MLSCTSALVTDEKPLPPKQPASYPPHLALSLAEACDTVARTQSTEERHPMPSPVSTVFLVDVDNTLLDNDRIREDIQRDFERLYGADARQRYWTIQERLFVELGYRDYLGALQVYRAQHPEDLRVLAMGAYLLDYPFAERVFPSAHAVLERLACWGPTAILTDGDVVYQPRKVEHAGLAEAVGGHVLIYMHKEDELADIERRYPAQHYVLVDDKPRLLAAVKARWGERVTTVLVRQGAFALDPSASACAPADVTIERIGDLLNFELAELVPPHLFSQSSVTTGS